MEWNYLILTHRHFLVEFPIHFENLKFAGITVSSGDVVDLGKFDQLVLECGIAESWHAVAK